MIRSAALGDAALAALLAAAGVAVAGNVLKDVPGQDWRLAASVAVAVGIAVVVALRRLWPAAALIAALTLSTPAALLGLLWDPFVAAALTLYTLVAARSRIPWWTPAAVAALPVATAVGGTWWYAAGAPLAGAAWWLGTLARERREQAARIAEQDRRQVLVEERLRIARELHDVLTHGMGLIAVQASVANHIADARPEAAREALASIETASRDALADVRRLLGTLREDTELAPQPSLRDLPALVTRAADAGVEVELSVHGDADVPAPVALATYRIVQEAVTNVVKHAAPAQCQAVVDLTGGRVSIEVVNDGELVLLDDRSHGHGLVGMRERVAVHDGEFSAGPRSGGGFRVTATLPYGTGSTG